MRRAEGFFTSIRTAAQGFVRDEKGVFTVSEDKKISMSIPTEQIPRCPITNGAVTMNLRSDDTFVEDVGWHKASERYYGFVNKYADKKIVLLELGVGETLRLLSSTRFGA